MRISTIKALFGWGDFRGIKKGERKIERIVFECLVEVILEEKTGGTWVFSFYAHQNVFLLNQGEN